MEWWIWIVVGFALLVFELVTPGIFFLFFGASALVVGLLDVAGLDLPLGMELLTFSVLAVVLLLVFRGPILRRLKARPGEGHRVDRIEDEIATTQGAIAVGAVGRAELRGTTWNARNVGEQDLATDVRCRVVKIDGLMLDIREDRADGSGGAAS